MPITASKSRLSLTQLHLSVLLAGGAGLFAKWVEASPAVITCGRTLFGSASIAVVVALMKSDLWVRSRKDLLMMALTGVILAIQWFSFFVSIRVSTVAIGLLAFSSFPLFVTFLEPLVFKERLQSRDVITAVLVVVGLLLVTPSWDLGNHLTQGVLWGVFSASTYALRSLMSRWYVRVYAPLTVAFYQQAFAALCALPFALSWQGSINGRDLGLLIILGVVFTGLAQGLAVASLRHLRAQTVGVAYGMEPVYGVVFAWLLLHELPSARTLCGGALICGAVLWASFRQSSPVEHELSDQAE
ncbi:MAG: DMT family transporter [Verrucomicrobia bacterium]|nr:DMT family transporter [Verrucomicrobiota bacterium]